jgi:nitrate reductase gamma subunit
MNTLLWVGFPYLAMILFFVVPVIRMAYRPFGITTRASSMFNRQVLGLASLLLHWGIILLFVGHLVGFLGGLRGSDLAVSWFYYLGLAGGVMAIVGSTIALIRRFTVPEVRALSQVDDYLVHVFLILIIGLGLYQSLIQQIWGAAFAGSAYFASLFRFQPEPELMAGAGLLTQIHVLAGFALAAYFPFTKLIHVWTYPINFAVRPYQSVRTLANKFRRRWEFGLRSDKSFMLYLGGLLIVVLLAVAFTSRGPVDEGFQVALAAEDDPGEQLGFELYVSQCARCHGVEGDGNGAGRDSPTFATLPRDLTTGLYRFISTQNGVASDADLRHVIVNGLPNAGMPGFDRLSDVQVDSLVAYLDFIWVDRPTAGPLVAITPVPNFTNEMRDQGAALYAANCTSCHGETGAGDGPAAAFIEDYPGHLLPPANLAAGEVKAGADPVQLYYRVAAGIPNGNTPLMPAYGYLSSEEIWSIVAHLRRNILPRSVTTASAR